MFNHIRCEEQECAKQAISPNENHLRDWNSQVDSIFDHKIWTDRAVKTETLHELRFVSFFLFIGFHKKRPKFIGDAKSFNFID